MHTLITITPTFRYGIDKSLRGCANSLWKRDDFCAAGAESVLAQNKKRFSAHPLVSENLYLQGLLIALNKGSKSLSYHSRNYPIRDFLSFVRICFLLFSDVCRLISPCSVVSTIPHGKESLGHFGLFGRWRTEGFNHVSFNTTRPSRAYLACHHVNPPLRFLSFAKLQMCAVTDADIIPKPWAENKVVIVTFRSY